MSKDILFIHPGGQKAIYQQLSAEFTAIAPPAWTLLLADYIRNQGYSTAIYDTNLDGWDEDIAKNIINKYKPKLIVIMAYGHHPSSSTQAMPGAAGIAREIKKYHKDIPIAMGGVHPSSLPRETLSGENIDFVIRGEGVYTLRGLLNFLNGKTGIKEIAGLGYKENSSVKLNAPAALIKDLDRELGGYAWDLLPDLKKYRAHNMHCFQEDARSPYATIYTSLGCPYSCSYCCINALFGKSGLRLWSLEKVTSWIDTLVNKYGVKNIRIEDELFVLSAERVERFCDLLIERNYSLNIWAYARVDTIKESLLNKMKRAGINWLCLGIESGNERVRKNVNKNIRIDIKKMVKMIQDSGIFVLGNYMFGLPEDTMETMEETFNLATDLNCEFVNFYCTMSYPGSELYGRAVKQGYSPQNWLAFSQHSYETEPLANKYLSAEEILKFRDEVFYRYYTNPVYLNMIRDKFGEKVKKHIEKMTQIKLKRKILEESPIRI